MGFRDSFLGTAPPYFQVFSTQHFQDCRYHAKRLEKNYELFPALRTRAECAKRGLASTYESIAYRRIQLGAPSRENGKKSIWRNVLRTAEEEESKKLARSYISRRLSLEWLPWRYGHRGHVHMTSALRGVSTKGREVA